MSSDDKQTSTECGTKSICHEISHIELAFEVVCSGGGGGVVGGGGVSSVVGRLEANGFEGFDTTAALREGRGGGGGGGGRGVIGSVDGGIVD